jgi:hypothetical protein
VLGAPPFNRQRPMTTWRAKDPTRARLEEALKDSGDKAACFISMP